MSKQKKINISPKKLSVAVKPIETDFYSSDFFGWTQEQTQLLKKRNFSALDIENLIEEIKSLGDEKIDKLESFLTVLLTHLLKKEYQPEKRTQSWEYSIKISRVHAQKVYRKNPSLKPHLDEIFEDAYYVARLEAAKETKLPLKTFPEKCGWTIDEVLDMETNPKMIHKPKSKK